jgi:hypothetical protein
MTPNTSPIDATPTWAAVLPILLEGFAHGHSEGRVAALSELRRLAAVADGFIDALRNIQRYDSRLDEIEAAPNGDDYNALHALALGGAYVDPDNLAR